MPDENENHFELDFDILKFVQDGEIEEDETEDDAIEVIEPAPRKITADLNSADHFINENGLAELPEFEVGGADETTEFVEAFLMAVRTEYTATGYGSFDCLLRFRHAASMDELNRFIHSVQARVSRIRREASQHVPKFFVVAENKLVYPDLKIAVLRIARMKNEIYQSWISDRKSRQAAAVSNNQRLKDLL